MQQLQKSHDFTPMSFISLFYFISFCLSVYCHNTYFVLQKIVMDQTLRNSSSMPNLAQVFGNPFMNLDKPTDLRIQTKDGVVFNVHQFILEAESSVLRKLIQEETAKATFNGLIKIDDFNGDTFRTIVIWFYSGELQVGTETVEALKQVELAAKKYRLVDMFGRIKEEKRRIRNSLPPIAFHARPRPSVLARHLLPPPPPPPRL